MRREEGEFVSGEKCLLLRARLNGSAARSDSVLRTLSTGQRVSTGCKRAIGWTELK
jgi:hypothetical protein